MKVLEIDVYQIFEYEIVPKAKTLREKFLQSFWSFQFACKVRILKLYNSFLSKILEIILFIVQTYPSKELLIHCYCTISVHRNACVRIFLFSRLYFQNHVNRLVYFRPLRSNYESSVCWRKEPLKVPTLKCFYRTI